MRPDIWLLCMKSSRKKDATAAAFDIEGFVHHKNDAAAQNHIRTTTIATTTTATYPMCLSPRIVPSLPTPWGTVTLIRATMDSIITIGDDVVL